MLNLITSEIKLLESATHSETGQYILLRTGLLNFTTCLQGKKRYKANRDTKKPKTTKSSPKTAKSGRGAFLDELGALSLLHVE